MFQKLFPVCLLLLAGCQNDPTTTTEIAQASVKGTVEKLKSTCIVCQSVDQGHSWHPTDGGLPADVEVRRMATQGERLILTTSDHGMFISDTKHQNWQPLNMEQLPSKDIVTLTADDSGIYVAVNKQGVFATQDEGQHWTKLNDNPKGNDDFIHSLFKVGDEIWAGHRGSLFAMSEAPLSDWREVMEGVFATHLVQSGQNILLGTGIGIALSKDGGRSWDWVRKGATVRKLLAVNGQLVATYQEKEAEVSTDAGKTWKPAQGSDTAGNLLSTVKSGHDMFSEQDGVYSRWGDYSLNFFGLPDYVETDFLPVGNTVYVWVLGRMDGC
ncbi:MAG: hypothetical protein IPN76_34290 [Saprospiraceae bacterium]|nr:hypothetical protein [Saprospiraceae bacterium]